MSAPSFPRQIQSPPNSQRTSAEWGLKLGLCLGLLTPFLAHSQAVSLATNYLVEGSAAGADGLLLSISPATTAWTATENAPWLHLTAAAHQGVGSTNVVFRFDANPGGTRTGTLTVAGLTLTVTQAGTTYVPASAVTLVNSGLNYPRGVGVDQAGNVYIADQHHSAVKRWTASTGMVTALAIPGLSNPDGLALDGFGNVYVTDRVNNTVVEWASATGMATTLISSGLNKPTSVAVDAAGDLLYVVQGPHDDILTWASATGVSTPISSSGLSFPESVALGAAGNLYIGATNNTLLEWAGPGGTNNILVNSGLNLPAGLAVDGGGNVFFADSGNGAIKKWSSVTRQVKTLVDGLGRPAGVAVDAVGNAYFSDSGNNRVLELPHAFVDPTSRIESGFAGSDELPPVLPTAVIQSSLFAPSSDSPSWLTISGITNGVVSYAFAANPSAINKRTGHLNVLGQKITVTQLGRSVPPPVTGLIVDGTFQLSFTGLSGASYAVLTTTNVDLPLTAWTPVGPAAEIAIGQFRFTNAPSDQPAQFFRVLLP